jgi:hypothetical protein
MHTRTACALAVLLGVVLALPCRAADEPINYDENKVPKYTLPDPLVLADGQRVTDAATWKDRRRPEVLQLFQKHVYGKTPEQKIAVTYEVRDAKADALDGKATRKQVRIRFGRQVENLPQGAKLDLLIYLPSAAKKPVPVFLGLNFGGNQAVHADPGIAPADLWTRDATRGFVCSPATDKNRATEASRWQVEKVLARGYGLATAYYGDIEPDISGAISKGVRPLFFKQGQTRPEPDDWGAIGAWAWGLSRALDYLQTEKDVDAEHVAVIGHSRLGKTALWAGAQDQRFALVISNNSGCGGAALERRRFGETTARITKSFPHWFCANYSAYANRADDLPVDQHELVALIAPRPVYVGSAEQDRWADPRGEFLSAKGADAVYRLLGTDGMAAQEMPPLEQPVTSTIGYHIRRGQHDVTEYDWQRYMDFADKHFRR